MYNSNVDEVCQHSGCIRIESFAKDGVEEGFGRRMR
jgi:hypothetical protein